MQTRIRVMDWNQFAGQWKQYKGQAQAKWGDFTDDDLDSIGGRREQLVGKLQERYGMERDQAEKEADGWLAKL